MTSLAVLSSCIVTKTPMGTNSGIRHQKRKFSFLFLNTVITTEYKLTTYTVCVVVVGTAIWHSTRCAGRCGRAMASTTRAVPDSSTNHSSTDHIGAIPIIYSPKYQIYVLNITLANHGLTTVIKEATGRPAQGCKYWGWIIETTRGRKYTLQYHSKRPLGAGFRSVNPTERCRTGAGFSQHLDCGFHRSASSPEGSFAIPYPVARWAKTTPYIITQFVLPMTFINWSAEK